MTQQKERRAWIRYDCALRSTLRPAGKPSSSEWLATVLNVSAGGIRFRLSHEFETGSLVLIEIPDENRLTLEARVIHAHDLGSGYYEIGCNFLRELDEAELKKLLT